MIIKTKYNIGDEVFILKKDSCEVIISKDKISYVVIDAEDIKYCFDDDDNEYIEKELVPLNDVNDLVSKIKEALEEKHEL